ncbi:MAG: Purine or other phosphorylase family 1 [Candidatus Amesbacteria bacterium GW2011_GWB1_47_19]|nr:MAG: Purine or other phosphorylase family 1 [Candidatus Amesbacteria bacterium GW2011_GWA1_44_24]KKU31036.1 MAG: Purine or other phosphorylase family 1 [Candidatus Amesbacteria bacterium GW2011_GWC1_46_24]KKU66652.1 MAG: Purine or other phosphorylase family 1 [Candidatus Amesbacteria bacterium GW2011_GWB1_47_19]OGD06147.1 MAG: hypothetical protein A2379_03585 [Candidatus Amesbacteria bacterium RIFOXYB1_FULL_47_13]HBC72257.1 hypothetical protein [Candidatus Amesbacteria bacterium]
MYKSHTVEDFKKYFGLPKEYKVDKRLLKEIIKEQGYDVEYEHLGKSFVGEVLVFKINGKRFWFETSYGGAYISEIFHFRCMLGSKKNIVLGTCGGLIKDGKMGGVVIPTYSHGDESTTRMYNPNSGGNMHLSEEKLSKSLKRRLGSKIRVYEGPVVTCQAMMFESWEDIQNWSRKGYLGVEMETSTVFAVSRHFNVPATAILIIADNLIIKETALHGNFKNATENRNRTRDLTYTAALEELLAD